MSLTNSQYDHIMRQYEAKRRQALLDKEARVAYINEHVDGYRELSEAIAGLSASHAKRAIAGDMGAVDELKVLIADLRSQKKALLISAGYPEDYLEPVYECATCKDTGYVGNEKCHCFKQQIISLLYDQSIISDSMKHIGFDMMLDKYYKNDDLKAFITSKQKAISFVDNFDSDYQNLLIYGTVGVGKSLLSSCIAKELQDSDHSVIYFSSTSLFDELSKAAFERGSKGELDNIHNCDLLIIDDLGTEVTNSFTISALFSLLNERIVRKKPIVISTNLSLENLRDRYTDRIFSRITGAFSFCHMTGPDIRARQGLLGDK